MAIKFKKGDIFTIVWVIFVLFALGIAMFVGHMILNKVLPEIEQVYNENEWGAVNVSAGSTVFSDAVAATNRMDTVYLGLFVGFLIAMIVSSFLTPTHPVMMGVFFMVMMILVVVSAILSNVWMEIANNATFAATLLEFPRTDHLLDYMPLYTGTVGLIAMVILYMRRRNEGIL